MRALRRGMRAVGLGSAAPGGATALGFDGGVDMPPPVPACPPGQRTGPPDFVGVGVQRCGTTRWFDLIASHPQVAQPVRAKELHYFDRFYATPFVQADSERYHAYFPRAEGQVAGEWTPLYMSAPWVAPLLAQAAPEAKLLVALRDPVERYVSGLTLAARVAERRGAPLSRYAPLDAFVRGLYHAQLKRLLGHFERSRLLLLQYERCTRDPAGELRRTFEFLALEDPGLRADLQAHPKRQPQKAALDEPTRLAYVAAYEADVAALAADFPELDLSLWPNFAHLAGAAPAR